jgi:hypothetical protein
MKSFTIENETNNTTVHATKQEATAVPNAECFSSPDELATLAANWPVARLIEIWNSLPGVSPVKKFTDRKTAATRIWKAIQCLGEPVASESAPEAETPVASEAAAPAPEQQTDAPAAEPVADAVAQAPDVASAAAPANKKATRQKKAPTAEPEAKAPSKTSRVIELLKREGGVTLKELTAEMGWQSHTTRALMSAGGSLAKKHGMTVVSTKGENGDRVYAIKS